MHCMNRLMAGVTPFPAPCRATGSSGTSAFLVLAGSDANIAPYTGDVSARLDRLSHSITMRLHTPYTNLFYPTRADGSVCRYSCSA